MWSSDVSSELKELREIRQNLTGLVTMPNAGPVSQHCNSELNHQGGTRLNISLSSTQSPKVDSSTTELIDSNSSATLAHKCVISSLTWERFGEAQVDIFANAKSAPCCLWVSVAELEIHLRQDALLHNFSPQLLKSNHISSTLLHCAYKLCIQIGYRNPEFNLTC